MKLEVIYDVQNYIDEIIKLDNQFYDDEYMWNDEYQKIIYERNKDSFIAILDDGILVGYINYLCITDEKYEFIKNSDVIVDSFDLEDVIPFKEYNNIFLDSVVIDKLYQNTDVVRYITDGLLSKFIELDKKGYHIKTLSSVAISKDGEKFLNNLGISDGKLLKDGNRLFINEDDIVYDMEESIKKLKKA